MPTVKKGSGNPKRERFRNVASKRVEKVLDAIDSLSKCANRGNYEYDDAEVTKMMKAIKEKVRILDLAFTTNAKSQKNTFKF